MKVPWTARRFNQSILKEISPEYSLKGLMMKLNLQYFVYLMRRTYSLEGLVLKLMRQYFGHLMRRADSLEKNLVLERLSTEGEGTSEDEIFG